MKKIPFFALASFVFSYAAYADTVVVVSNSQLVDAQKFSQSSSSTYRITPSTDTFTISDGGQSCTLVTSKIARGSLGCNYTVTFSADGEISIAKANSNSSCSSSCQGSHTSDSRIALYIGLYVGPGTDTTIKILQESPLTSPILGLLNQSAPHPDQLVYNDSNNPLFNTSGDYIGSDQWAGQLSNLRGGNIREVYLSFSTSGTVYMSNLVSSNKTAAQKILSYIKNELGFDGVDLDYEGQISPSSPIYAVAVAAIEAGLKLTAAPYYNKSGWQAWVQHVQNHHGTVSWLNLQCYAGGKSNNPGTWLDIGVPIVAGSCNHCANPQTTCSPANMQGLFTLWRTGQGSVSSECWDGTPNTIPQAIGGGFIWSYNSIKGPMFLDYMDAVKSGLGM